MTSRGTRLGAMVLLAGSVRESAFARDLGRSPLDLPLRVGQTVIQTWCRHAADLAERLGLADLSVRVLVNRQAILPSSATRVERVRLTAEFDPQELRGTAGVLRDVCDDIADEDMILVGHAYQLLLHPLQDFVREMFGAGGDAAMISGEGDEPIGLFMVRRRALDLVKAKGFVDFKEQAIPLIAERYDVRVAPWAGPAAVSLRTLDAYLNALRRLHAPPGSELDPLAENWFSTFSLVEPEAEVAASARVHDSVVLGGARVGPRAVLVRSVVCGGATVAPGDVVLDRVVPAPAGWRQRGSAA